MKTRILSQLYALGHQLPDAKSYMEVIINELNEKNEKEHFTAEKIDERFVSSRSLLALKRILHSYNYFRIETIDSFFQSVLRNLARELDLSPNLRIELSDKEIEHKAVDTWINCLKEGDKELNWILDYIRSNMDDEKSWNIIGDIKKFGESLLSDEYKQCEDAVNARLNDENKNFYSDYTSTLNAIIMESEEGIKAYGEELVKIIETNGFCVSDFKQGARGVAGYIYKMVDSPVSQLSINSYVQKALDPDDTDATNWITKKCSDELKNLCCKTLRPRFIEIMDKVQKMIVMSNSATITLRNMPKLRLLRAIQKEMESSNKTEDRFLLSDTQNLLRHMIQDNDAPFIFEKIGSRLGSIMIDEFQDTSRIQWQNFKVLLEECMSHSGDNMLVGDVKQSIYRWRSGDWRLLNNIKEEFPTKNITVNSLVSNYRSAANIINFNNIFFKQAAIETENDIHSFAPEYSQEFRNAYDDVVQKYPENKKSEGYVDVKVLEKTDDYKERTFREICSTIQLLLSNGFSQNDIAILIRSNDLIPQIADYCTKHIPGLKIISNDAFRLDASPALQILVDALAYLDNPEDSIVFARLSTNCNNQSINFCQNDLEEIKDMPLYRLCEELCRIFKLYSIPNQEAYISCFFDNLRAFIQKGVADRRTLIQYWHETICSKKVESDTGEGVRTMSIHKSKGLEFPNVILPFCDWEHEHSQGLLWCKPEIMPFAKLPVLPINYSQKQMCNTIYEGDYLEEHMQNTIDNINLLYVAMTRASSNMFIITQQGQKAGYRGAIIEKIIPAVAKQLDVEFNGDHLTYGELLPPVKREESIIEKNNVFEQESIPFKITFSTTPGNVEFRESNQSKEFTTTEEDCEDRQRLEYINIGNVVHNLLSTIKTYDDLQPAITRLQMDGTIGCDSISIEHLSKRINSVMNHKDVKEWFSDKWRTYNECTILEYDKSAGTTIQHRPDRVIVCGDEAIVIDFKLSVPKGEYITQVQRYMSLLKRMGYKNVKGYLMYIMTGQIQNISQ